MTWSVVLVDEVDRWYLGLVETGAQELEAVTAAIDLLEAQGPNLSRPLADRLKGSRHHNMKELRPAGTNVRILFVFDPRRNAVLLVSGDKTGDWKGWYRDNIPVAEARYEKWLAGGYEEEEGRSHGS